MKKIKSLLIPILFGMVLAGCGDNPVEPPSNQVVYTFEGITNEATAKEKLTKKGTKVYFEGLTTTHTFGEIFKDNNFVIPSGERARFVCLDRSYGGEYVWIRKIEFTFADGKDNLSLEGAPDKEKYENGVWTSSFTESGKGQQDIDLISTGVTTISKIVITTAPYVANTVGIEFTGLLEDEKVYYQDGPTFVAWEQKELMTSTTKLVIGQKYYFWVEWGQYHKDFFKDAVMKYKGTELRTSMFYPSDESQLPKDQIIVFEYEPDSDASNKNIIDVSWLGKEANKNIKIDVTSANKYVKGFMETDPLNSLNIGIVVFGGNAVISARTKKGYMNLKAIINGTTIEQDEDEETFKFQVPFAKEINISFTAEEGDEDLKDKTIIPLTGDNADKGKLVGAERDEKLYVIFFESEDHPTAVVSSLSFNGTVIPEQQGEEGEKGERGYYELSKEQTALFNSTQEASRPSLFSVTINENPSYKSTLSFNKGSYKVEIDGKEPISEGETSIKYEVDGKSSVTVKITPNEYLDIHSVEVNDRRLETSEYTLNPDGSINYTFTANAKSYEFLIQTKAQLVKLELDNTSTTGYNIKDLPADPVECGKPLTLTVGTINDDYALFGKKITVTYNGAEIPVSEENFSFTITPIKDASKIKVVVEDKPLE